MANDSDQAQTTTANERSFYTIAAAEAALRQEQQRNDVLSAKLDEKFDELGKTIGGKLDNLLSLLERVLATTATTSKQESVPPPLEQGPPLLSETLALKIEVTPIPPLTDVQTTTSGLRSFSLLRTQSDSETDRRQFMQRDRSLPPRSQSPTCIPIQPFSRRSPSPNSSLGNGSYKPLTGVKLPIFHGRYMENVNAWITIIEDRFFLAETPDNKKIADISALFMDDALVWYLDLRTKYLHGPPSWEEFKMELHVKFADSPVRMSYLRKSLKTVPYGGPNEMEQYISAFRSIEIQITENEMRLGDRLKYFLAPFNTALKRRIMNEHPKHIEIAYDAALDYANVIAETEKPVEEPTIEKKLGLSQYIKKYPSVEPSDKSKPSKSESSTKKTHSDSDSDSEEDLDIMSDTGNKTCFRCQKLGHVAADCLTPRPVPRSAITGRTIQNGKRVHFSQAIKY